MRLAFPKLVLAATLFASSLSATHFRYGHLTWRPTGANAVEFNFVAAFRYNGYGAPIVGSIITETIGATSLNFGDGSAATGTLRFEVTAINPGENWLIAEALAPGTNNRRIPHTYVGNGPFIAAVSGCCRISTLQNTPDAGYRIETPVSLLPTNNSPVSSLPPIVNVPVNTVFQFDVPAADSDPNTRLQWRFADATEFGAPVWPGNIPNMTIASNTGRVTWNTAGLTAGNTYACQYVIEDRNATTNDLKTKVSVDFILLLIPRTMNRAPFFTSPNCGVTINASVGVNVNFTVRAEDLDVPETISLNVAGLPPGATMTPGLPISGTPPQVSNFNWIPTGIGVFVVNFTVTDSANNQTLCPVTINVGECFLLLGLSQTQISFGRNRDLLVDPFMWPAVTMEEIPVLAIPNISQLIGIHIYSQIVMFNPVVFPNDPVKFSNGIDLQIGREPVLYGPEMGMQAWVLENSIQPGGQVTVRFRIQ